MFFLVRRLHKSNPSKNKVTAATFSWIRILAKLLIMIFPQFNHVDLVMSMANERTREEQDTRRGWMREWFCGGGENQ